MRCLFLNPAFKIILQKNVYLHLINLKQLNHKDMKIKTLSTILIAVSVFFLTAFTFSGDKCPRCDGEGIIRPQCQFCNGGYRECSLCYGKSEIRCTYCQGGGSFRCNSCAGRGYNGEDECSRCSGKGEIECEQCHGTGLISCPSCGAQGHVACMTCGGRGYTEWRCPDCNGTGQIDND